MASKIDSIAEYTALFIINLLVFFISMFLVEISVFQCVIYSIINSIWMKFLIWPLFSKINNKKNEADFSKKIKSYISNHEERQVILKNKFLLEDKEIEEKNKTHKFDWKLFRKYLKKNDIKYLYHFTDKSNLPSIKSNSGLFSWKFCENNDIKINRPGGNNLSRQLDTRDNLQNFVRLSFNKNHPMLFSAMNDGRILEPIILEIDIEVIFFKDTLFSNMNATKNDAHIGKDFISLKEINLEVLKSNYNTLKKNDKDFFQAEVLVKNGIELKYIKNIT